MSVPEEVVNIPEKSLPFYADILNNIAMASLGIGILLIVLVPLLKKWMGDVK
jgi:POT family proton-dependent oligopeptide transporter